MKLKIFSDYPWPGLIVGGPAMSHAFKLGSWAAKAEGDASYEETNPNYDMETFEHFPGLQAPSSDSWQWEVPRKGTYYAVAYTNCDVPILDDVNSNLDAATGLPKDGASDCKSTFSLTVTSGGH